MNRPGAFAEMISIPKENIVELGGSVKSEYLAMTEPAAVALHAVRLIEQTSYRPISEGSALVIGGGAVGVFCVYFLRDYGCKNITLCEINADRRRTMELTGLCEVVDPTQTELATDSFDAVFDAVGNSRTRDLSVSTVKSGGVVTHIGLSSTDGEMDVRRMTLAEITFIGTYTYTARDFRVAADKLQNFNIGPLDWIDERPLSDGNEAFQDLLEGRVAAPKVILRP